MSEPFASVPDLEVRWRSLTTDEVATAAVLLDDASAYVRSLDSTIDSRIEDGDLDEALPRAVVARMVKRSMSAGVFGTLDGVTQHQQSAGPFSQSVSFAAPTGDLYITKAERKMLGISTQRAFMVDTTPDCSLTWPWNCCEDDGS